MGCDCCGPSAATPITALNEETSSCQDFCRNGDEEALDTETPRQREPAHEQPNECCSSDKCADDKVEDDTDEPICCRGKVGPCCDTSCLDRLAMRECEMSTVAAPNPNKRTDGG